MYNQIVKTMTNGKTCLLRAKEEGVEVGSASTGLEGEDPAAVLGKVKGLEHVKCLEQEELQVTFKPVRSFVENM